MSDGSYPGPAGPSSPLGPDAAAGQQLIGGRNSRPLADARVGINIDTNAISTLKNKLKELTTEAGKLRKEMEGIARASSRISLPGSRGGSGGAYGSQLSSNHSIVEQSAQAAGTAATASRAMARPTIPVSSATTAGAGGAGGAAAAASGGNPYLAAATVALQLYGKAMQAMDNRIARGVSYATSADRTNMLLQQLSGMSQQGVMATNRAPLTRYKLGESPDALLQFAATYGIDMQETMMLGRSVEALRASSGYSKSASSILSSQQQFMAPEVANRMLYMVGTNAYEFGGGLRDPLQMRQEIISRMGLADPNILRGAFTPGSVTRLRMAQAGIGEEAQTEILQYAQQQYQFQQKGGRGFYDPSSKADRQLMGVENNLANQQEETARLSVAREERFMQKQIDNMTETEKYQQDVVRLLTSMDDSLAGLYGARQGYSGAAWKGFETGLAGTGSLGDPVSVPTRAVSTGGSSGSGSSGSGSSSNIEAASNNDANIFIPYGDHGTTNRISLDSLKQKYDFRSLDAVFQSQLLNLYRVNPSIGFGGGSRTNAQQEAEFLTRYQPGGDPNSFGAREWNGEIWTLKEGYSVPLAPPGLSYHEYGLAVDLSLPLAEGGSGFDPDTIKWMRDNLPSFNLRNFEFVDDEPWHIQPINVPTSYVHYDPTKTYDLEATPGMDMLMELHYRQMGYTGSNLPVRGMGVISGEAPLPLNVQYPVFDGTNGSVAAPSITSDVTSEVSNSSVTSSNTASTRSSAFKFGQSFRRQVSTSSSGSRINIPRHNSSAVTGLEGSDFLGDPGSMTDQMSRSRVMPTKSPSQTSNSRGSQVTLSSSSGSGSVTVTVAPTINFNGMPKSLDLRNIAQTVSKMIKEEVDMLDMRNS